MSLLHKGIEDKKPSYQKTSQNGAPPLARLQQKVARLEISLRDKDSELSKLNESTKATLVSELRIQTEMYYQEVLRLRNQLNVLQETQIQQKPAAIQETSGCINELSKQARENKNLTNENGVKLMESVEKLKNENNKLSQKLSSITADKEKLSKEFQEVLKKADKKLSKKTQIVMEESTQTSPKLSKIREVSPPPPPPPPPQLTKSSEDSINLLKIQIEELLGKEKAWEEERANFKELIVNLQEDRSFYKDVSQQKHEELGSLQNEMMKLHKDVLLLQKDISVFNDFGKPLCSQCTQNSNLKSSRPVKSKSKSLMRSSKSLPKSQNIKNGNKSLSPSETSSPSSLPIKTVKTSENCSKIIKSKVTSSSASTSGSNSAQTSPLHIDSHKKRSSSHNVLKSSESTSTEERIASPLKSESSISDNKDMEIANEILKDLDESGLGDSVNRKYAKNLALEVDGEVSSLNGSPKHTQSSSRSISKVSSSTVKSNDSHKNLSNDEDLNEKHHLEENLSAIFESHLVRSSKLLDINPKWKSIVSRQRRKLVKKKEREKGGSTSLSTDQSQETEEEIEEMMSLLEAHVNRKAFLTLVEAENENSTS